MRDLVVLAMFLGCIGATVWRPWLGVLALAAFSYLNPQAYSFGFMRGFPGFQILFLLTFVAAFATKDRQPIPKDWRIPAFFFLWSWYLVTTLDAELPNHAWARFLEISKVYLPLFLMLWLINTREKLHWLIVTIALSFGLVAAKGGVFAVATGFNYRVWGPDGTHFSDNNNFAIAVIMSIPLLVLWFRESKHKWVRLGLMAAIPLSVASALSSWSRGALLTLGATGFMLLWNSRHKWLAAPLILGAAAFVFLGDLLPQGWHERMGTIETYEEDASAMSRIKVWGDGIEYAFQNPLTGAGFEGWRMVTDSDWHSSYVEMMAEHGLIAFGVWLALLFGSIASLTQLPILTRRHPELGWVRNWCTMLRASLIAYAVGTLFLGLAYWDIFYQIVFAAVLVKKFALEELAVVRERETRNVQARRLRPTAIRPAAPAPVPHPDFPEHPPFPATK